MILNTKMSTLIFIIIFLLIDYIIREFCTNTKIKQFYLKFTKKDNISIFIIVFVLFFVILTFFSYFDITLIKLKFSFDSSPDIFFNFSDSVAAPSNYVAEAPQNQSASNLNTVNAEGNVHINHPNLNVTV